MNNYLIRIINENGLQSHLAQIQAAYNIYSYESLLENDYLGLQEEETINMLYLRNIIKRKIANYKRIEGYVQLDKKIREILERSKAYNKKLHFLLDSVDLGKSKDKNIQIKHLEKFYDSQKGADFLFQFTDNSSPEKEVRTINLHSGVLTGFMESRSELICELIEAGENTYRLKIDEGDPKMISEILKYIYTSYMNDISDTCSTLKDTLIAYSIAKELKILKLEEFLKKRIKLITWKENKFEEIFHNYIIGTELLNDSLSAGIKLNKDILDELDILLKKNIPYIPIENTRTIVLSVQDAPDVLLPVSKLLIYYTSPVVAEKIRNNLIANDTVVINAARVTKENLAEYINTVQKNYREIVYSTVGPSASVIERILSEKKNSDYSEFSHYLSISKALDDSVRLTKVLENKISSIVNSANLSTIYADSAKRNLKESINACNSYIINNMNRYLKSQELKAIISNPEILNTNNYINLIRDTIEAVKSNPYILPTRKINDKLFLNLVTPRIVTMITENNQSAITEMQEIIGQMLTNNLIKIQTVLNLIKDSNTSRAFDLVFLLDKASKTNDRNEKNNTISKRLLMNIFQYYNNVKSINIYFDAKAKSRTFRHNRREKRVFSSIIYDQEFKSRDDLKSEMRNSYKFSVKFKRFNKNSDKYGIGLVRKDMNLTVSSKEDENNSLILSQQDGSVFVTLSDSKNGKNNKTILSQDFTFIPNITFYCLIDFANLVFTVFEPNNGYYIELGLEDREYLLSAQLEDFGDSITICENLEDQKDIQNPVKISTCNCEVNDSKCEFCKDSTKCSNCFVFPECSICDNVYCKDCMKHCPCEKVSVCLFCYNNLENISNEEKIEQIYENEMIINDENFVNEEFNLSALCDYCKEKNTGCVKCKRLFNKEESFKNCEVCFKPICKECGDNGKSNCNICGKLHCECKKCDVENEIRDDIIIKDENSNNVMNASISQKNVMLSFQSFDLIKAKSGISSDNIELAQNTYTNSPSSGSFILEFSDPNGNEVTMNESIFVLKVNSHRGIKSSKNFERNKLYNFEVKINQISGCDDGPGFGVVEANAFDKSSTYSNMIALFQSDTRGNLIDRIANSLNSIKVGDIFSVIIDTQNLFLLIKRNSDNLCFKAQLDENKDYALCFCGCANTEFEIRQL